MSIASIEWEGDRAAPRPTQANFYVSKALEPSNLHNFFRFNYTFEIIVEKHK